MKRILVLLCIITGFAARSQQLLIPYKAGDLFGLSNEDGKLIIAPAYDKMEWLSGQWFETGKRIVLKDTLEMTPGRFHIRNETVMLTGLIHQGKTILKDEPYNDYEIILDRCIVAESEMRSRSYTKEQFNRFKNKERFYSLFSTSGTNLYPDNFKRIRKMDTTGTSTLHKKRARYILFWAHHFEGTQSLFVFDMDKQLISDWLLKQVDITNPERPNYTQKVLTFDVRDKNYSTSTKIVDYSSGKFILYTMPKKDLTGNNNQYGSAGTDKQMEEITMAVPDYSDIPTKEMSPDTFVRYHQLLNDSLFNITGTGSRSFISLPPHSKIVFREEKSTEQYGPLIYRQQQQFGLIENGRAGATLYDSLVYFGQQFLAWQTINGKTRCGVIDAGGKVVIPVVYDSMYAGLRVMDTEDYGKLTSPDYRFVLKEAGSRYQTTRVYPYSRPATDILTVYQNGKCGVIRLTQEIIIPVRYDMIAQNGLNYMRPKESDFIILKSNGRYGITRLKYNRELKRSEMDETIEPVFSMVPCFYLPDYYNRKGQKLIGLFAGAFKFKGYASEKGKEYFTE
jgi:WG containing repeat